MFRVVIAFVIGVAVLLSQYSLADDKISVKVVSEEWQGYTNSDGTGLYWAIIQSVYPSSDFELELTTAPWKRAKHLTKNNVTDAYVGDYYTPSKQSTFLVPELAYQYRRRCGGQIQNSLIKLGETSARIAQI